MTNDITIIDGGMGQELYRRSGKPASPLWSAQVMLDRPELVVAVHREFIEAGAQVITLNSYAATPERLTRDADISSFEPLQNAALQAAHAARDEAGSPVRIAGCLPPLVASYHPDLVPDDAQALSSYRRIVDIQAPGVDLFIAETLSTVREAEIVCRAVADVDQAVWVSFTVSDSDGTRLRSDESLRDGINAAKDAGAEAVLINCSVPEAVTQAMELLVDSGIPFGGLANGFTSIAAMAPGGTVEGLRARDDLGPVAYADHAINWIGQGASLIGGCCEVGPDHIAEIRNRLA
jgi:homocysteine S-methyltransferase